MQESPVTAIQAIQAILAPALGISAVGLLLLALMSRYSTIVNRIRLLNEEKRRFTRQLTEKGELAYTDNARYMSIRKQTEELLVRSSLVRNAVLSMQMAVGMFVLSSIAIGLNLFVSGETFKVIPLIVFLVGMICIVVGVVFSGLEVHRSFKIVLIEVKAEE
jgi:steroid 5-alpha reductase family enzyme